jgi:hypothetical protein
VYGLDSGDTHEDLDGCDEEKLSVGKDVASVALTTVHSLYLMELDTAKEAGSQRQRSHSFNALSPGQMQDLERSFRPRMLFSLPAGAPHDVVGEHLQLKRLLRNNAALGTELAAQAAKHASLTSVGALCVTIFLPCVCLRAGFRPCFQGARR